MHSPCFASRRQVSLRRSAARLCVARAAFARRLRRAPQHPAQRAVGAFSGNKARNLRPDPQAPGASTPCFASQRQVSLVSRAALPCEAPSAFKRKAFLQVALRKQQRDSAQRATARVLRDCSSFWERPPCKDRARGQARLQTSFASPREGCLVWLRASCAPCCPPWRPNASCLPLTQHPR